MASWATRLCDARADALITEESASRFRQFVPLLADGYKLANDGQDTRALQHDLRHKNIKHTVRCTELSPERFKSFWDD